MSLFVPDSRCGYLAPAGSVCNKCGQIHNGENHPSAHMAWLRPPETGGGAPSGFGLFKKAVGEVFTPK